MIQTYGTGPVWRVPLHVNLYVLKYFSTFTVPLPRISWNNTRGSTRAKLAAEIVRKMPRGAAGATDGYHWYPCKFGVNGCSCRVSSFWCPYGHDHHVSDEASNANVSKLHEDLPTTSFSLTDHSSSAQAFLLICCSLRLQLLLLDIAVVEVIMALAQPLATTTTQELTILDTQLVQSTLVVFGTLLVYDYVCTLDQELHVLGFLHG
ncbi:hypothetical protein BDQ12DRAFT_265769 [Crucibulum laeve]|uniref:Uncharacterized protein n=1 Tax=Crucibulum laeve TaxID=68775 RepID=A0A5C3LSS9_9AGAR|nr:hypothetical protein BDQ12DRAFT_265769 [Crucibulum laeve]